MNTTKNAALLTLATTLGATGVANFPTNHIAGGLYIAASLLIFALYEILP